MLCLVLQAEPDNTWRLLEELLTSVEHGVGLPPYRPSHDLMLTLERHNLHFTEWLGPRTENNKHHPVCLSSQCFS